MDIGNAGLPATGLARLLHSLRQAQARSGFFKASTAQGIKLLAASLFKSATR